MARLPAAARRDVAVPGVALAAGPPLPGVAALAAAAGGCAQAAASQGMLLGCV